MSLVMLRFAIFVMCGRAGPTAGIKQFGGTWSIAGCLGLSLKR
jgi:hypothetical protein